MTLKRKGPSVAQALRKIATKTGQNYNELRVIFAIERAVARLERMPELFHHLIFKGGFVLLKEMESPRYTRDLDATAVGLSRKRVELLVQSALKNDFDDGIWFGSSVVKDLKHDAYPGLRFQIPFQIGEPPQSAPGQAKLSQIDLDIAIIASLQGFPNKQARMVSILSDSPAVSWSILPPEYIFAEKLEALISLGSTSSRAKDIYDLVQIFPICVNQTDLWKAISTTFTRRQTTLPNSFAEALSTFDLTALKRAWPNVGKSIGADFDTIWSELVAILTQLNNE